MKKIFIGMLLAFMTIATNAQSWVAGTQKLYANPDTTKVGIGITSPTERLHVNNGALKIGNSTSSSDRAKNVLKFGDGDYVKIGEWEADDLLSFKANRYDFVSGNVGIGVKNPQYKLDVNGKIYLRIYDTDEGFGRSYIHWQSQKLILGVPEDDYAHTMVEIKPGGSSEGPLFSSLSLYHAYSKTQIVKKIHLATNENSWINNNSNFGIGTTSPQYKLDVRGTIRATEIIVNTAGADFVFEDDYSLRSLQEVKSYIAENHHLPEIPSAQEMREEGMSVDQMVIKLLQKVEELTLYNIQLEERINELENIKK